MLKSSFKIWNFKKNKVLRQEMHMNVELFTTFKNFLHLEDTDPLRVGMLCPVPRNKQIKTGCGYITFMNIYI